MAQLRKLQVSDNWFARLNAAINDSVTSCVVKLADDAPLNTTTIVNIGTEKIAVTSVAYDTPSSGLDTLTIERGYGGTTAASHAENDVVAHLFYENFFNEAMDRLYRVEGWCRARVNGDGVILPGGAVTAQGTPSMTVDISAGGATVSGQPVSWVATTLTFIAPVTNPRIDRIVINQYGVVYTVAGTEAGSPSAPAQPTNTESLALITHTVAETVIKNTNDATNGYITDARTPV